MNQRDFEQQHWSFWQSLTNTLDALDGKYLNNRPLAIDTETSTEKETETLTTFAADYRRLCHQLSLARQRGYSPTLTDYLNTLVLRGHRTLYRQDQTTRISMGQMLTREFPRSVRQQWKWHLGCALLFVTSGLLLLIVVLQQPEQAWQLVDNDTLLNMEHLYQPDTPSQRYSDDDLLMFGFYIYNNLGVAFRSIAGGLFLGVGTLIILAINGSFLGVITGHLLNEGSGEPFFSFVIAHGAPELIAIVLASGAGLQLGWALVAPGPYRRLDALQQTARRVLPVISGILMLLVVAAFIEAFWSARDILPTIKYSVGIACWWLVISFLLLGGRHAN